MNLEKARKILKIKEISVEKILEVCEAIWIYKGKQGEPHALLTSGKHSDGYINLNRVLQFPNLCKLLAKKLIELLEKEKILKEKIDAIFSSSFGAITFGYEVARQLGVMFVFTEKKENDQKWTGRFELPEGTRILQVEEIITTLGTARKVKEALLSVNPNVKFVEVNRKTVVATILWRPEKICEDSEYIVIPLIKKEIHVWEPQECPLCKKGSIALRPKENWKIFHSQL